MRDLAQTKASFNAEPGANVVRTRRAARRALRAGILTFAALVLAVLLATVGFPGTAQAGITFESYSTAGPVTGTSVVVGVPSGAGLNDMLVAQVVGTGVNPTITPPTSGGWTLLNQYYTSTTTNAFEAVYWKRATNSESSYTWSFSSSATYAVTILCYNGVTMATTPITPTSQSRGSSTSSAITWPTLTPTVAGDMLVALCVAKSSGVSFSNPSISGTTLNSRQKQNGAAPSFASWDLIRSDTTATGTFASTSTTWWVCHDILLLAQPAPSITSNSPASGVATGGTSVTITGAAFTNATAVTFGTTPAASFTVNSNTSITAVSPPGTGVVDVRVTTPLGTSPVVSGDHFSYVPVVSSLNPTAGPLAAGTTVVITGNGFTAATAVKFGSTSASSYTVNSDTQITAVAPAGSAGTVSVNVTTAGGTSATGGTGDDYTYTRLPTVTARTPTSGPATGGTSVALTGAYLTGATAVKFGTTNAASYTVNSSTSITAVSPAGTGVVDITVTTAGGTSATSSSDRFSYVPVVDSLSPSAGPLAGGTSVIITGDGFTAATAVKFGVTSASSYTVNSDTQITATSPAGSAGTVSVSVTTAGGTSATGGAGDDYTYTAAPTVTGRNPTSGLATGGTSVAITGTNLTGATAVKFGGTDAASYTVNSATSITAVSPAGAGLVDITVTTAGGTSATSSNDRFSFVPVVTDVEPGAGPLGGGTSVVITGNGFTAATAVKFGSTNAASYTVNSDTQVTATSPAGTGTVDITVTTAGGTSATSSADYFTYTAAPTVTGVSPSSGPATGGTSVIITGANLTGATAVMFGSTAAAAFTVNSATQITAASPAASAGTIDITVTTAGGTSATSSSDRFTFVAAPTVTGLSPASGVATGATSVTITGTNLTGATAVMFGSTAAASYTVNSATSISATSPAGAGVVDVTVTTVGGTSATGASDRFSYVPVVTGASPGSGPLGGGTSVTVTGKGFTAATAVKFGGTNASSYTVNSDTQITATSPAGTAGTVDITVTTAGGTSATGSSDRFSYVAAPTVTGVSPGAGPTGGGTTVTISGTGFSGATAVKFGVTPASFSINSSTSITATSPSGSAGTVDVRVTTAGGTSSANSADHFIYLAAPTIGPLSPSSGSVDGGETVTISGTNFNTISDTTVTFGGTSCTVTGVTSTSITVTAPARDNGGAVDVVVTTPGGTATATSAYTYVGRLDLTNPSVGDFGGLILNGAVQTTTAAMGTFTVTDSRGTGVGWNVTVQATRLTAGVHTLPWGSISMPQPSVAKGTPQSTGLPNIPAGPYAIDSLSAIKIASAAAGGSGEGSYIFTTGLLTLSVPASVYAGTYTSTVVVSVITGP
jgi:large repetitive protein